MHDATDDAARLLAGGGDGGHGAANARRDAVVEYAPYGQVDVIRRHKCYNTNMSIDPLTALGIASCSFFVKPKPVEPTWLDRLPWIVKVEIVILWGVSVFKLVSFLCA